MATKKSKRVKNVKASSRKPKAALKKQGNSGTTKARASKTAVTTTGKSRTSKKPASGKKASAVKFMALAPDPTIDNLDKIEHIVVLMMENRSFDHMLGYLTLENGRTDIDGLTSSMSNSYNGQSYPPKLRTNPAFASTQDPCHAGSCVAEHLQNDNGGFISNYMKTYPNDAEIDLVMNYYNGATLKVYDQLVKDACVCDRWFSSVPGATWPNRLYSIAGQSGGTKDNKSIPVYNLPSFVRYLSSGNVPWRWYSHTTPATLRLVDSKYRDPFHLKVNNFAYFGKHSLLGGNSFLEDAAQGKLASVSWIDPDFGDAITHSHVNENDDHPPVDITAGQELVLKLYNAVISGPQWDKTLLVVVYDEHGGLFDHVTPPSAPDDRADFRQYGVRVPAFVVSPWADANTVSHTVFDHTSLIKTILLKFCRRPDGSIPDMGARVTGAAHLGSLLTRNEARPTPTIEKMQALATKLGTVRAASRTQELKAFLTKQATGDVKPLPPNDIQVGMARALKKLREAGLPEGQP